MGLAIVLPKTPPNFARDPGHTLAYYISVSEKGNLDQRPRRRKSRYKNRVNLTTIITIRYNRKGLY